MKAYLVLTALSIVLSTLFVSSVKATLAKRPNKPETTPLSTLYLLKDSQQEVCPISDGLDQDYNNSTASDTGKMNSPKSWISYINFPDPGEVLLDRAEHLTRNVINKIGSDVEYNHIMSCSPEENAAYIHAGAIILGAFASMALAIASQVQGTDYRSQTK